MKKAILGDWFTQHRSTIFIVCGLFLLAAVPRLLDLGSFITADERNWMFRSYEFIRAFKDFRFNDMLQTTHPGVTTMWISGVTIIAKMFFTHIPFTSNNLLSFLKTAQFPIAFITSAAVPVIYLFLRKLFQQPFISIAASVFIALDPFLIGYSRVIHVDALLTVFLFLAVLAVLLYARTSFSRFWLIMAAVLSSLAILTKAPAVFIVPYVVLVVLVYAYKEKNIYEYFSKRVKDSITGGILICVLIVFLWPALLWVPNPQGNVLLLKKDIEQAATTPHDVTEEYQVHAWHYPATLLTRTSIPILILSIVGIGTVCIHIVRQRKAVSSDILVSALLIAYIFFFVFMMTLGAKKGDRYILPVFPAMDVLAAVGLVQLTLFFSKKGRWSASLITKAALAIIGIWLGCIVWRYHPYAIAYSNPLLPDNLSQELGWGEGLEQVGTWLSQQKNVGLVASWYPDELSLYTSAQVVNISAHDNPKTQYVVLYRNMFGRSADHPATQVLEQYYGKTNPVFIAHVAGKEFAWVYERQPYELTVGELLPGTVVRQNIAITREGFTGLKLLLATYNGRADRGDLHVRVVNPVSSRLIYEWNIPISDVENDQWMTLRLPDTITISKDSLLGVGVYATGTQAGNAPTLRYTHDHDFRSTDAILQTATGEIKNINGDLAIEALY